MKQLHLTNVRLPSGFCLTWDMTTLTDEQLEYEYHLAHESLHGHYINDAIALPGLLSKDLSDMDSELRTMMVGAIHVWKERYRRSMDEMERRFLLS